jgi:hypothetical protein
MVPAEDDPAVGSVDIVFLGSYCGAGGGQGRSADQQD